MVPALRMRRWCRKARIDPPAGVASEAITRLARAEDAQYANVASGHVAADVRADLLEYSAVAIAGQFTHAWMLANRVQARVLAQPVDCCPNRPHPASCRPP